jgi:paraquat-inducible protein A
MSAVAERSIDEVPDVLGCESCGQVSRNVLGDVPPGHIAVQKCSRCGHTLHGEKPFAVQRTWACAIASAILYVPANTLPVMVTDNALRHEEHTLIGGILQLWVEGSWMLAIIVFIASIAVPVLKIGVLGLLAWTVRHAPAWRRLERARLYRLIENVGHWSMLDVYVVVVLAATVRFGPIANVAAGPGLLAFAAVVLLTLVGTWSFDPKMIWREPLADERRAA